MDLISIIIIIVIISKVLKKGQEEKDRIQRNTQPQNPWDSVVGSDAHNINKRTSLMYDAYDYIKNVYGHHYANKIFKENPKKMLEDIDIRKENKHE